MIPKHRFGMTLGEIIQRYWDHAERRTDATLQREIERYADAKPPSYDYEWREICKAELRHRACEADRQIRVRRLRDRIRLNSERIGRGEYDAVKLTDLNRRLTARIAVLEGEAR